MSIPHPVKKRPPIRTDRQPKQLRKAVSRVIDAQSSEAITAVVLGVDQVWRGIEAKWGVGRLPVLISDETRLSMRRGMIAWQTALMEGDVEAVRALGPKIIHALGVMGREAERLGHKPLDVNVWEVMREDGTVVAITRTSAEAGAVARDGRALEVWSLEEVGRVLPRPISDIKRVFPGARAERMTVHGEAYAQEWITSDAILAGEPLLSDQPMPAPDPEADMEPDPE
jgi:hypothetical protein